jgi:SAM-dependent methyltransferase
VTLVTRLMRLATDARQRAAGDPFERIRRTGRFCANDIQLVHDTYFSGVGPAPGGPWDGFREAHLELPEWFQPGLDPFCVEYVAQQHRLWRLIAGVDRDYDVGTDEKEADWGEVDAVRFPGHFKRRDPLAVVAASDHVLATGMMLKHCGLKPGDWALEYGAGFAQTALTLARLGVNVDTVDVSERFCGWVRNQAAFFGVPLTPFEGRFGDAPRPEQKYQVVWFYESFHHCLDFARVIRELPKLLAPGGRVILSGEPIVERENAAVPYPWGLRLHSEVTAVVRRQRWFELGFSEDFLFQLFANSGFVMQRIDCEPSLFGRMYVCEYRPARVPMARQWMPPDLAEDWGEIHGDGRWSGGASAWPIEIRDAPQSIRIELENPSRFGRAVEVDAELGTVRVHMKPCSTRTIEITAGAGAGRIRFHTVGCGLARALSAARRNGAVIRSIGCTSGVSLLSRS